MNTRFVDRIKAPCQGVVRQLLLAGYCALATVPVAVADVYEQARRIHDRLTGVPPTQAMLDAMVMAMEDDPGNPGAVQAALLAIDNPAKDTFYSVTLKNMVTPATNREQTAFAPLNDYTATVIGVIRDELDFRKILWDNILYVGRSGLGIPAYSNSDNRHYEEFERTGASFRTDLEQRTQSSVTGFPAAAVAGVMTSRAAARAFFVAGTNRANFRFTLLNQLCHDMEQVQDITRVPDRIRQDVTRSPGGDANVFLNNCIGCHSGMDPMAQAFAYYNYVDPDNDPDTDNGSMEYTAGQVQPKYLINGTNFPYGYITENNHWDNYWREGPNSVLDWDPALPGSGDSASGMGRELAHSGAFAQCQVTKAFRTVCLREPEDQADRNQIASMVSSFKANNYNLKQVFAESASYCKGD